MSKDEEKRLAARAALRFSTAAASSASAPDRRSSISSTRWPNARARSTARYRARSSRRACSSSTACACSISTSVDEIPVYVDGADECDAGKHLIKGGGGALTREKIIAAVADKFVCIIDAGKRVDCSASFRCRSK